MDLFIFLSVSLSALLCLATWLAEHVFKHSLRSISFKKQINTIFLAIPGMLLAVLSLARYLLLRLLPEETWPIVTTWTLFALFLLPPIFEFVGMLLDIGYIDPRKNGIVVRCPECNYIVLAEHAEVKCLNCNSSRKLQLREGALRVALFKPATWLPRNRWLLWRTNCNGVRMNSSRYRSRDEFD